MKLDEAGRPALFERLTRDQARDYLARFVGELPASQEMMADMLGAAGGDPGLAYDLTPAGLDPIWAIVLEGWDLSYQADFVPSPFPTAPPLREATWEALGPVEDLPSWFAHDWYHVMRFSPATLWVIDVLGRHLAQMLIASHPDLDWMVGPDRPATNIDRSRPVVGNGKAWINTMRRTRVFVEGELQGEHPPGSSTSLRGFFDTMDAGPQKW